MILIHSKWVNLKGLIYQTVRKNKKSPANKQNKATSANCDDNKPDEFDQKCDEKSTATLSVPFEVDSLFSEDSSAYSLKLSNKDLSIDNV